MILYRPVGTKELALIEESGYTRYPPRLPEQPIFYRGFIKQTLRTPKQPGRAWMDDSPYGVVHCGTIYVEEDSYPRLAYEKLGTSPKE